MENIKFYSESDLACSWMLNKIIEMIKSGTINHEWVFVDLANNYNTLKYLKIENFRKYISENINHNVDLVDYENQIKRKIGEYINNHKLHYLELFKQDNFIYHEDYFEILEKYKIYDVLNEQKFKEFILDNRNCIRTVLKFRKIVERFKAALKEVILEDSSNAEIIISSAFENGTVYLPNSLTVEEKLELINRYIISENANVNILRRILTCHKQKLPISDKIKLSAERKLKELERSFFKDDEGFKTSVSILFTNDINEAISIEMISCKADIKVNISWIEENLDFQTLFNNFIYLFNIVDTSMRVTLVSKKCEIGIFESISIDKADHLYNMNFSFTFKEMTSDVMLYGYSNFLRSYNIRVEDMITWFFNVYVDMEFAVKNFSIHLPQEELSYLEKCRTILPEIDRVLKQYAIYVIDRAIDQDLVQISSSSVKYKDYKSLISKKYVYPIGEWSRIAIFLLFSNQSHIFYIQKVDDSYSNFYELIWNERLAETDFEEYQIRDMKWLFDNNIIRFDNNGIIQFSDLNLIYILKEFFYNEVLNYWRCPKDARNKLDTLIIEGHVEVDDSLFSRPEQDFFNYYLDNSQFTNGLSLRNSYMHGTNPTDKKLHEAHYYIILKLFIIICIKINDDLCLDNYLINLE